MHRHSYKGRKFGRERDQRTALLKGLATALVERGRIETTMPKAKELVPYVETLITKAKLGTLHGRRQVIAALSTESAAHKLVDEIAAKLKGRTSGHLRIKPSRLRLGDNAQLALVSFVDDISPEIKDEPKKPAKKPQKPAAPAKAKQSAKPKKASEEEK